MRSTTLAEGIEVGQQVWSKAERGDGTSAKGGVVVTMDGPDTVVVIADGDLMVTSHRRGDHRQRGRRGGELLRLRLVDLDPGKSVPASSYVMHETARKALAGAAASGRGELTDAERELVHAAISLLDEAAVTQA